MKNFTNGFNSWYLVIITQAEIHRFFIKSSILMVVFLATSLLSQAFVLVPFDSRTNESFIVRTAEYQIAKRSNNQAQEEIELLKAKVEASVYARDLSNSAAELITTIMKVVIRLAILFFCTGLTFWVLYSIAAKNELQINKLDSNKSEK